MSVETKGELGIEGLLVWKKAVDLAVEICKSILPTFPNHEIYALSSQLRRSIQSVPANIAEGYGRFYYQEGVRYSYIARGSLEESRMHLLLAYRLNYLTDASFQQLDSRATEVRSLLNGYIAFLKRTKRGESEPGSTVHEQIGDYFVDQLTDEEHPGSLPPHNSELVDPELD